MKSINLTVDDDALAKAQKLARQNKTSVATLLQDYLQQLTSTPVSREMARRQFKHLSAAAQGEVGPRRWTRDDLYDR